MSCRGAFDTKKDFKVILHPPLMTFPRLFCRGKVDKKYSDCGAVICKMRGNFLVPSLCTCNSNIHPPAPDFIHRNDPVRFKELKSLRYRFSVNGFFVTGFLLFYALSKLRYP